MSPSGSGAAGLRAVVLALLAVTAPAAARAQSPSPGTAAPPSPSRFSACWSTCRSSCLEPESSRLKACSAECGAMEELKGQTDRKAAKLTIDCNSKCEARARFEAFECQQGCVNACDPDADSTRCASVCLVPCESRLKDPDSPAGWNDCLDSCKRDCEENPMPYRRWLRLANDGRERFEATAYTGIGIDSFAAGEINDYINPEVSGDVKTRGIAGADLAYRLWGSLGTGRQVWFFGRTRYGVRSTEVDCDPNHTGAATNPLCDPNSVVGNRTLAIIRDATSLEAYFGLRYEFQPLQKRWSGSASSLYLRAQAGFLTVAGGGGDVVDVRLAAIGVIGTNGRFQGSYVEAGYGRTDLFIVSPHKRLRVNGYLTWRPSSAPWRRTLIQPFAEMTVDADLGPGSDSVQSSVGVSFDLDALDPRRTYQLGGS